MFLYDLTGKQVVLVLARQITAELKPLGIPGSPLYAKVFKAEEKGLWLDNPRFSICPVDKPHLYDPEGEAFCHAHVFIRAEAIVSVAVFPDEVKGLEENAGIHRIGFQPPER